MLQQPEPDDFVVGTGETHTVREFVDLAFETAGLEADQYVRTDSDLYRPAEVNILLADPAKARTKLGWEHRTSFRELVREMVVADCRALGIELAPESANAIAR
jgi:GDPmannose 4,6-dehydratase